MPNRESCYPVVDTSTPKSYPDAVFRKNVNDLITRMLYYQAAERATSARWNTISLMLIYVVLSIVLLITLFGVPNFYVAIVAVLGLAVFWLVNWLLNKRMQERFYEQELRHYWNLFSNENETRFSAAAEAATAAMSDSPLTERELEVLEQAISGKINKEIGHVLGMSEDTVRNHFVHIFDKLGVRDRTAAAVIALRKGWIS
jgi:DNA-binding CsgD family transcriptional regulator